MAPLTTPANAMPWAADMMCDLMDCREENRSAYAGTAVSQLLTRKWWPKRVRAVGMCVVRARRSKAMAERGLRVCVDGWSLRSLDEACAEILTNPRNRMTVPREILISKLPASLPQW